MTQKTVNDFDVTSPIIYVHPTKLKPHPLNARFYVLRDSKRDKNQKRFEQSIEELGILVPIVVNAQNIIISGHRRWRAANKFSLETVPIQIRAFENEALAIIELNRYREKYVQELLAEVNELEAVLKPIAEAKEKAGVSQQFINPCHNCDKGIADIPKQTINVLKETAKVIGVSHNTLAKMKFVDKNKEEFPKIWRDFNEREISVDKAYQTIKKKVKPLKPKEKHDWTNDVQLYNVWSTFKLNESFGEQYPGRTPHQIIVNLLHYYTEEGALVLDPMAGGGTAIDVCKVMNRKCVAFDITPKREDIKENDILHGIPVKDVDFVFLDPPYYKQKEGYSECAFTRSLEDFYEAMHIALQNCFDSLKKNGKLALMLKPMGLHENENKEFEWADLTLESFLRAKKVGFTLIKRICVPLSTQQYKSLDVARAKKNCYMLNTLRDVLVFKK